MPIQVLVIRAARLRPVPITETRRAEAAYSNPWSLARP